MAGTRHRFERKITLRSARAMRAGAGRPSPLFRRHRLRAMVGALRNARRQVGRPEAKQSRRPTYHVPLRHRWRRAMANLNAWVARRIS